MSDPADATCPERQLSADLDAGLSVVIPVYRSEASLESLFDRLVPALDALGLPYEIVCVNDGSPDRSWSVLARLRQRFPDRLVAIDLMRNFGQHSALLCGVRAARFDVVVTMDDDLQHPPEEIAKLLDRLEAGDCDVVYATPERERHGFWRNVASVATKSVLQRATGVDTFAKISAFRAFRTEIRNAFAGFHGSSMSIDVLLTWGTARFEAIETRRDPRRHGKSNYTFGKLVLHTLNMITGFGAMPLRLAACLGISLLACGCISTLGLAGWSALRAPVDGMYWIAAWLTILCGLQLLGLGAIGEYLGRMHAHAIARPGYVVRSRCGPPNRDCQPIQELRAA